MTDDFYLEKYELEDFRDYYALVKDDLVMRYITGKGLSEEAAQNKFASILQINAEDPLLGYYKVIAHNDELIGDCKLVSYKKDSDLLEIGYLLKKKYWGMGWGTKICEKLLGRAATIAPHQNIIGVIDPDNLPSKRLLEKFGFKSHFIGVEDDIPTEKLMLRRGVR